MSLLFLCVLSRFLSYTDITLYSSLLVYHYSQGKRGDPNVDKLFEALEPLTNKLLILDDKQVHWFPRHISELDLIANRTLDAGVDLECDHPGFNDAVYRKRRGELAKIAQVHACSQTIPRIDYTDKEVATWSAVWDQMEGLWEKYACAEYKVWMSVLVL